MYRENWIPVDVLWKEGQPGAVGDGSGSDSIKTWCTDAAGDKWDSLFPAVLAIRERLVVNPKLQYCQLRKETDTDTAISIFINVNRSAIKLKEVDIAVAIAQANHGEDLRGRVKDYLSDSEEVRHYFNRNPSKAIPEIAAWMLKVSCLKVANDQNRNGLPPKESHFPSAVTSLFESERALGVRQLESDLDSALRFVAERGGATRRTLAAWPPVHVIAALQGDIRKVGAGLAEEVSRLLSAYVWRSFLTERYKTQANDRLLEDFQGLRQYLLLLSGGASGQDRLRLTVPAFDEKIPTQTELARAGWIGSASRLGRAIAAVGMAREAVDWVTGEKLTADRVRDLEERGELSRHYVFSPSLFKDSVGEKIKLGLNGVLLSKCPKWLTTCDPDNLLQCTRENHGELDELAFRSRVGSHVLPYLALAREGVAPSYHYNRFIKERSMLMAEAITALAKY